jgi:putative transposase
MKSIPKAKKTDNAGVSQVCLCFDIKRDAYYKYLNRTQQRKSVVSKVLGLVSQERIDLPRGGTRKLYKALKPVFEELKIKVGRDSLFDILRENNMLITRKKAYCNMTNSYHHFHKYNNLVKDIKVSRPNQVWVSDITYIRTIKGFCYLALRQPSSVRISAPFRQGNTILQQSICRCIKKA